MCAYAAMPSTLPLSAMVLAMAGVSQAAHPYGRDIDLRSGPSAESRKVSLGVPSAGHRSAPGEAKR